MMYACMICRCSLFCVSGAIHSVVWATDEKTGKHQLYGTCTWQDLPLPDVGYFIHSCSEWYHEFDKYASTDRGAWHWAFSLFPKFLWCRELGAIDLIHFREKGARYSIVLYLASLFMLWKVAGNRCQIIWESFIMAFHRWKWLYRAGQTRARI